MIAGKIFTQAEDKLLEQWPIEKDLISAFAKLNDGTFTIVAVVFIVTAIITLVATVILAVRAAKLILIIASFKKSAKSLFRTSKKVVKRFFRFTYCPKGQKIYIRFCKLLN